MSGIKEADWIIIIKNSKKYFLKKHKEFSILKMSNKLKDISPALRLSLLLFAGALAGFLNGFLGSGGGIILIFAMTFLCRDMSAKERFSTAVASVLPMSLVSAVVYLSNGSLSALFGKTAEVMALGEGNARAVALLGNGAELTSKTVDMLGGNTPQVVFLVGEGTGLLARVTENGFAGLTYLARFLIPGAIGGVFGSFVMDKISPRFLKLVFASLMVFAGIRMITR